MENIFEGIFKMIFYIFGELFFHLILGGTGYGIRYLFGYRRKAHDDMEIIDYILGIGFYILIGFGIYFLS